MVLAVVVAGGSLLHLARQRQTGAWESLWAEDGSVFLTDAHRDFADTLFAQNGGYVHVVPRAIAGVAAMLPVEFAATTFAVLGSVVVALSALFVYFASGEVLRSSYSRLGLAAAVLLLPVAGAELYANAVNLHFYLVFACFWALVWQSTTPSALVARSGIALAATLSDPVCALLVPLAVVAPLTRRSVRALVVPTAFLVGVGVQLLLMRGGESPERNWEFHLEDLPDIFSLRVGGGLLVGDRLLDDLWLSLDRTFSYAALTALAVLVVALLWRSNRRMAAFALLALSYAGLFFCVHLVGRGTGGMDPEVGSFHLNGARYVLLPFLFSVAALLALIEGWPGRSTWPRAIALAWLGLLLAVNLPIGPNTRSEGPRWSDELTISRVDCSERDAANARILVAPAPPDVWFAEIPCSKL